MTQRRPTVGGNWKMNLHGAEAEALAQAVARDVAGAKTQVTVFPAFPYLERVGKALAGKPVNLGAQDFYIQPNGAFTGEVSLSMLKEVGVKTVLVGHSERRHVIGESDILINQKVLAALEAGMEVVLCVGEKIEQRERGQTDNINSAQVAYGLAGVKPEQMSRVTIAYEPVWAIGTGKNATPQDAQLAHRRIREILIHGMYGAEIGNAVRIQYGGSVKADNAKELFAQPDVDGGLIGGASLKAADFAAIVRAAEARA